MNEIDLECREDKRIRGFKNFPKGLVDLEAKCQEWKDLQAPIHSKQRKERECLICDKKFTSEHFGLRYCSGCRKTVKNYSSLGYQFGLVEKSDLNS